MAKSYYCFLEKFNNYFNRKIIRYETLAEYITASNDHHIPVDANSAMTPFDFNLNDNVTTEIIANDLDFDPDYFLELDASQNILSRWFIVEQRRNRQGQWLYSLKRDVISDNVVNLMNAPVFVQKGIVGDDNPLILNSEGMNFNQIKVEETLLKDKTNTSWLIGYIAKSQGGADVNVQVNTSKILDAISLRTIATDLGTTEAILSTLLNFDGIDAYPTRFVNRFNLAHCIEQFIVDTQVVYYFKTKNHSLQKSSTWDHIEYNPPHPLYNLQGGGGGIVNRVQDQVVAHASEIIAQIETIMDTNYYFTSDVEYIKLKKYEGRYIHYLGKYYKLHIVEAGDSRIKHDTNFVYTKYSSLQAVAVDAKGGAVLNSGGYFSFVETYAKKVYIQMQEVSDADDIPQADAVISSNRNVTQDQQFDLIAIPAGTMTLIYDDNGTPTEMETNGEIARRIISQYALDEDANVYDIQLLPYCPVPYLENGSEIQGTEGEDFDYITATGPDYIFVTVNDDDNAYSTASYADHIEVTQYISGMQHQAGEAITIDEYSYVIYSEESFDIDAISITIDDATGIMTIYYETTEAVDPAEAGKVIFNIKYHYKNATKVVNAIFYCQSASFQQQLDYQLSIRESMKIDSQCDRYRLLSPNYQGSFEFNVAKNGGAVDFFTAYCTYKPYTPFIKVCPAFSFVYGMDYNDNRGLICGGDFSLPRISSAWQSYQLNNKNYQNIFNREIQNLDFVQSLEMRQQVISGGIGIGTDSVKGAMAGAIA